METTDTTDTTRDIWDNEVNNCKKVNIMACAKLMELLSGNWGLMLDLHLEQGEGFTEIRFSPANQSIEATYRWEWDGNGITKTEYELPEET